MKSILMKFVFIINGGINLFLFFEAIKSSENSMLLLTQGWVLWYYFALGCFASRSVNVGSRQHSIFVSLVLSRE